MRSSASLRHSARFVHLYLGVFIAPALLFFAFTGALQTFSLHETTRGSSYKPPAWAVTLAQLHKKQTTVVPVRRPPPPEISKTEKPQASSTSSREPATTAPPKQTDIPTPRQHNPVPLKIFFLIVSIGLCTSTLSGLYMAYKYIHKRGILMGLLLAGTIVPVILSLL